MRMTFFIKYEIIIRDNEWMGRKKIMQKSVDIAMLLLMGGKSSRMGTSKAILTYEGIPFWKRIATEMEACGPLYLSVARIPGEEEVPEEVSPWEESVWQQLRKHRLIEDVVEAVGPMGGILSAMEQIKEEAFFVCACDMPFMSQEYIRILSDTWRQINAEEEWDALMVRNADGRIYTTTGIYHKRLMPRFQQRIAEGNYRMMALLRENRVYYLEEESLGEARKALENINTMEEYKRL